MRSFATNLLFSLALLGTAFGGVVVYPEYPSAIERDHAYEVSVTQGGETKPLVVYNHCEKSALTDRTHGGDVNRRFCEFAFDGGAVRVDVRVRSNDRLKVEGERLNNGGSTSQTSQTSQASQTSVFSYKVFPARLRLKSEFKDGVISVFLDNPAYFGIQLNDYDKTILSVFADAPESADKVPVKGNKGVMVVEGWLDATNANGVIEIGSDIREVYLSPGSVLNARVKIKGANTYFHGRGIVLDPFSNIFRFDQTKNTARGLFNCAAPGITVEDVKLLDARTFNFMGWSPNLTFRNVKVLSSMMCSDGITIGGKGALVENAWLYVGDNALVVSGVDGAVFRNVTIGTSCAAIFPQGDNKYARMENIDVFRADDGLINNVHNSVLRRNNKWNEMNACKAKKEPGPQELKHHIHNFHFKNLSAVDCTLFSHFFHGHNMGTLPKRFVFDGCAIPHSTGRSSWRAIGKQDGVAIDTHNDSKRWLDTDNYTLTFTNLWIGGVKSAFADNAIRTSTGNAKVTVMNEAPGEMVAMPNRHEVAKKPSAVFSHTVDKVRPCPANVVAETNPARSVWQRCPSWLVKLEATHRENGKPVYRLVQCERGAGMQAVITERFLAFGNGKWHLQFDLKAMSETPFGMKFVLSSNEKRIEKRLETISAEDWRHFNIEFDTFFDLAVTDMVSVGMFATAPADEICLQDISMTRP